MFIGALSVRGQIEDYLYTTSQEEMITQNIMPVLSVIIVILISDTDRKKKKN